MIWDEFTSTLADILSTLILGHTKVTITESKEKKDLWQMIPGVWEKFLHLRSFTWSGNWAKSSRPVWRKVTLRPPGLLWMPPSPAVVTIKRPAIQPSPSLSTHFSINMKMAKESQTQIYFINLHQVFNGKTPLRSSFKWFALLAKSWNLVSSEAYRDLRIWKLASMKWIVSNKRLVLKGAKWTTRI